MQIDEDWIPIALILLLAFIFGVTAWRQGELIQVAQGAIEFGLGAIAGYMARNKG